MRIEGQVCSLELAKRLKELGVEQDSLFYYGTRKLDNGDDEIVLMIEQFDSAMAHQGISAPKYRAFTVAELGEMLPDAILFHNSYCYIKSQKKDNEYKIYIDHLSKLVIFFDENEADVRAKMLIYLIENGLMKKED